MLRHACATSGLYPASRPARSLARCDMPLSNYSPSALLSSRIGSALLRVLLLGLGITVSVAFWQILPPSEQIKSSLATSSPGAQVQNGHVPSPAPVASSGPSPRVVYGGPAVSSSSSPSPASSRPARTNDAPPGAVTGAGVSGPALAQVSPPPSAVILSAAAASTAPTPAPATQPLPEAARSGAGAPAPASSSVQLVDLNTASVEDLNGLGGGMIGRAIVRGRPYRSVEDLLAKRVLNRSTFQRIAPQVAVR